MENKLEIHPANDNDLWDKFIFNSENKNLYSLSQFIDVYENDKKKFFIKKKEEILGSFHLFIKNSQINPGNTIYSALNFKKFDDSTNASLIYKKFLIIEKYSNFLIENYKKGEITLDHYTNDLRPFYWHNFKTNKEIFKIKETRFTSILDIKDLSTNNKDFEKTFFYSQLSRSTKQQIKLKKKKNYDFKSELNLNLAKAMIEETFKRQKKNIDWDVDKIFKIYNHLYENKLLKMFICSKDKINLSFTIFGVINNKAIYLNGARSEQSNQDYSLTYNMISSLFSLKEIGVEIVDLEGVNSPKRGFWKLGFGGSLSPYYNISFD